MAYKMYLGASVDYFWLEDLACARWLTKGVYGVSERLAYKRYSVGVSSLMKIKSHSLLNNIWVFVWYG